MVAGPGDVAHAVKVDVKRLHETWMELFFPRQRGADQTVLGKWTPNTTGGMIRYRAWGAVGILIVALLYPLAVVGYATRFYASRLNTAATRIGIVGVVLLTGVTWGLLTAYTFISEAFSEGAAVAVAAATVVATVSAAMAMLFRRVDGRPVTVALSYPFAVTAVFLPPVVAALFWGEIRSLVFDNSYEFARTVLNTLPALVSEPLRSTFELGSLGGILYAVMWFAISFPVGWFVGLLVTLANVVRPSGEDE